MMVMNTLVRRCFMKYCGPSVAKASRVESCTSEGFLERTGFYGMDSTFFKCTATAHYDGFSLGENCLLDRCTARWNLMGDGITISGTNNIVRRSVISHNLGGIYVGSGARGTLIQNNTISVNGRAFDDCCGGLYLDGDDTIVRLSLIHI